MANTFCHLELSSQDVEGSKKFYSSLFDWKLEDQPSPDFPYTMIDTGAQPGGGMMSAPSPQMPSYWLAYVQVEDVEAAAARATELGGTVMVGKTAIPNQGGHFAVLSDPAGAAFGVWQPPAGQ